MNDRRKLAEQKGRRAETIAAWWMRLQGYRIIAKRVRNPRGEIDLIARRGRTTAFIEVKARSKASDLEQSIDAHKMRRVVAAAQAEAHKYVPDGHDIRFDAILIAPLKWPLHLKNIWHDM